MKQGFDERWIPEPNSGCWLWFGACNYAGYGIITLDGQSVKAHRFSYERAKGKIPFGFEVDHLCQNKCCVNPDHLEAVTGAENKRRAGRTATLFVAVCESCGTEIIRKKKRAKYECWRCIHRRACKTYSDQHKGEYYRKNRKKVLAKMRENYQKKKVGFE